LQPALSLARPEARDELIPWCHEHGVGVIVYSPMASGLLSGAFSHERLASLADDDWRKSANTPAAQMFREPQLTRNLEIVERLRPIAERHGVEIGAVAIAWTLAVPGVTAAIVGARRPGQVDGWLPAADLQLDAEELAEIEQALSVHSQSR
jgi:aryl-alcohol dehydrogenase-like predicted oxidoreductase